MVAEARRALWLYRRLLGAQVRATLQYEADFWIMSLSAVLVQAVGVVFLWAIFRSIPEINGWQFWEVVLIYALVVVAEGLSVLVAQGAWTLAVTVNFGQLDAMLLRPYPPVLQVLSSAVGMNGLGNLVLGTGLLIAAVRHVDVSWNVGRVALGLLLVVAAAGVKIGLNLLTNCAAFWLRSPYSMFAFSMHSFGELARFPVTIYGLGVRITLTVVLPYAFMSFFPAAAVLAHGPARWLGLLTPVVAIYCLWIGTTVFRYGLSRYESSGH
ncbi:MULTISPECIES: ABC transporter permease [Micromonospora]|uniref:ABC transporter permease n=1 Tax=Micromonospora TaxID=1873 RepID=UPI0007DB62BF|nr:MULTISPECIES: ABC-2 family transporter protein [Micromonospora]PPA58084.1 ABC transporter permease [Micromonospora chalcea]WBB83035.1 ABC-2 family transporter protein [Micromonospora sp. WMMC264]